VTGSLDTSVRVPKDVVFRELDGEAVILNLESGMYFGLDAVGTRIWRLVQEHGSLREVWEAMQREFDASDETLRSDLLTFIDELSAKGLVTLQ
jgi:coenzyme PQQ synthesis protein D (PqqD)